MMTPCKVIWLIRDPSQDVEKIKARILQNHAHLNPSDYQLLIEVVTGNSLIHHYHYQGYLRSCDLLEYTGNGSGFGDEKKDQLGVIILEQYHIYSGKERFNMDYHAFYQYIHHLFSTGQYGKIIYHIHQYETTRDQSAQGAAEEPRLISTYRSFKSRSPEDDALSLCYYFYAKSLEKIGMDDIAVIDAYKRAYQRSDKNLIAIYDLLIKLKQNNNLSAAYRLYEEVYGKDYPVKSLTNDVEGSLYLKRIKEIAKSEYFGRESPHYPIAICYMEMEMIDTLIGIGDYRSAYQIGNRIITRPEMIPRNVTRDIYIKMMQCMEQIKDDPEWTRYPDDMIAELTRKAQLCETENKPVGPGPGSRETIFTITTCKRFDLFEKTINSFINCNRYNGDLEMIAEWYCVDDNSSEEDQKRMMERYPFFKYRFKTPEEKGHIQSMNMIRDYIMSKGYKYNIHFEDDWQSICNIPTIQRSVDIMEVNPLVHQVVHNRNYAQSIRPSDIYMEGGYLQQVAKTSDRYLLHQFYMQGSPEFLEFVKRVGNTIANWPHYSLNPSVVRSDIYQRLGPFQKETWNFEFDYGVRFLYAGFQTAFLDGIFRMHIGKEPGSDVGKNAYELNDMKQ